MTKLLTYCIVAISPLLCATNCKAQAADVSNFSPREQVIFEDDFHRDLIDEFPSKWHGAGCSESPDETNPAQYWHVLLDGRASLLRSTSSSLRIAPKMRAGYHLPDSFTVEFDYLPEGTVGCAELNFQTDERTAPCALVRYHLLRNGELRMHYPPAQGQTTLLAPPPRVYDIDKWHHFSLSYDKKALDIYIDDRHVYSKPDCGFTPNSLSIGCIAPAKFRKLKIATGKRANAFSRILTENKFVTHAINFDVNKSVIKPESAVFIHKLADFLKANPTVKLEINGHTDSDGDKAKNRQLSQARASEVMHLLVSLGINAERLVAKGYGDANPLQPNTTPEGKAENRRVEFIRL